MGVHEQRVPKKSHERFGASNSVLFLRVPAFPDEQKPSVLCWTEPCGFSLVPEWEVSSCTNFLRAGHLLISNPTERTGIWAMLLVQLRGLGSWEWWVMCTFNDAPFYIYIYLSLSLSLARLSGHAVSLSSSDPIRLTHISCTLKV